MWLLLLQSTSSRALGLWLRLADSRHRFSSGGTWAELLRSMWDLPRSGTELISSALAGGFFTTEPPGKPQRGVFLFLTKGLTY